MLLAGTPPRHPDIDDRTEEKEDDELGKLALHGNILRLSFPSPAAFWAAAPGTPAQIVVALDAVATFAADGTPDNKRAKPQHP